MITRLLTLVAIVFSFSIVAFAADTPKDMGKDDTQMKIQMHEHMAKMNQNAADCLKSGKTEKECHEAMMAECKDHCKEMTGKECKMGKGKEDGCHMGCPMMGMMGHDHMHGKMGKKGAKGHE